MGNECIDEQGLQVPKQKKSLHLSPVPKDDGGMEDLTISPLDKALETTDYQQSPYVKLTGGLTYLDENNSPINESSPCFA